MAAKKVACPRCSGTGIYAGYGVCYRCRGAKVVNKIAARKPKAAKVWTEEEKEARRAANPELYAAAESYVWDD